MSALIGCTNAISKKVAKKAGVTVGEMKIERSYKFNRLGTMLMEQVIYPLTRSCWIVMLKLMPRLRRWTRLNLSSKESAQLLLFSAQPA